MNLFPHGVIHFWNYIPHNPCLLRSSLFCELHHPQIEMNVFLSKSEIKRLISIEISKKCQMIWNNEYKDIFIRFRSVLERRRTYIEIGKKYKIISRLRIGHTALNYSLCLHM